MEVFKGAVLNIKFGAFYVFSRVFFTPLRYDYPSDVTLVLWQYGSRIRGGLQYYMSRDLFKKKHVKAKVTCTSPFNIGPRLDILDLLASPNTCRIASFDLSLQQYCQESRLWLHILRTRLFCLNHCFVLIVHWDEYCKSRKVKFKNCKWRNNFKI